MKTSTRRGFLRSLRFAAIVAAPASTRLRPGAVDADELDRLATRYLAAHRAFWTDDEVCDCILHRLQREWAESMEALADAMQAQGVSWWVADGRLLSIMVDPAIVEFDRFVVQVPTSAGPLDPAILARLAGKGVGR